MNGVGLGHTGVLRVLVLSWWGTLTTNPGESERKALLLPSPYIDDKLLLDCVWVFLCLLHFFACHSLIWLPCPPQSMLIGRKQMDPVWALGFVPLNSWGMAFYSGCQSPAAVSVIRPCNTPSAGVGVSLWCMHHVFMGNYALMDTLTDHQKVHVLVKYESCSPENWFLFYFFCLFFNACLGLGAVHIRCGSYCRCNAESRDWFSLSWYFPLWSFLMPEKGLLSLAEETEHFIIS